MNAEIVQRARTQAGNLAHAVKTPLTILANAAALRDGTTMARPGGGGMWRTAVVTTWRAPRSPPRPPKLARRAHAAAGHGAGPAAGGPRRLYAQRGLNVEEADIALGLVFRGEQQDLQEMLGNLLDNACKWAAGRVLVTAGQDGPGAL